MDIKAAQEALCRRAVVLEIGGFRPPEDRSASWFGRVGFAAPGEAWPTTEGSPMHALCQVNVDALPLRPKGLEGVAFLTVFVGPRKLPVGDPNGVNWCLRAYPSLEGLVPLEPPASDSPLKAFPMRPLVVDDFPMREDVPVALDPEVEDAYYDHFKNVEGFKLGGWPTLVQSEVFWSRPGVDYVFQIDSTAKGRWSWGYNGVGYFGRGQSDDQDEWVLEWQCM